jgi:hypothetical protein
MPDDPIVPEYEPVDGVSRLEELTIAIHEKLNDPSVERLFGRNAKAKQTQARRIVWVPMGGQLIPPRQGGGRPPGDGTAFRIQSCQDRQPRIAAHIHARTYEQAEALLDRLIAATMIVIPNVTFPAPYEETTPLRTITGIDHVCGTIQEDGTIKPQEG